MQTKLDNAKAKVETFLIKKNIDFSCTPCEVDSEDGTQKHIGYTFETKNVYGTIIPNYKSKKAEFLVLNQNLMEHLIDEGYTDDQINESGKIWIHFAKLSSFQTLFELSEKVANLK